MNTTRRGSLWSRGASSLLGFVAIGLALAATGCEKSRAELACETMLELREKAKKEVGSAEKKTCVDFFGALEKKQSALATDCTYAKIIRAKTLVEAENGGYECMASNGGAAGAGDAKAIEAALDAWDRGVFGDSSSRKKQVEEIQGGEAAAFARGLEACVTECKAAEAGGAEYQGCLRACKKKKGLQ